MLDQCKNIGAELPGLGAASRGESLRPERLPEAVGVVSNRRPVPTDFRKIPVTHYIHCETWSLSHDLEWAVGTGFPPACAQHLAVGQAWGRRRCAIAVLTPEVSRNDGETDFVNFHKPMI